MRNSMLVKETVIWQKKGQKTKFCVRGHQEAEKYPAGSRSGRERAGTLDFAESEGYRW